jgi:hypothetical protein
VQIGNGSAGFWLLETVHAFEHLSIHLSILSAMAMMVCRMRRNHTALLA